MGWKRILGRTLAGLAGLTVVAVFAAWAGLKIYLDQRYARYFGPPVVVGMPDTNVPPGSIPAYDGPHPAVMERPDETFPFPIAVGETGPVEPLFAGPPRYPFVCLTEQSGLGQPLVDNHDREGIPVFAVDEAGQPTEEVAGYSRDCSLPTRVGYWYNRAGTDRFYPLDELPDDPAGAATVDVDGEALDFVVRVETGTINRFPYFLAALMGPEDRPEAVDTSRWNRRLIYQFRGGVGVGRRQGRLKPASMLTRRRDELAAGYAVAYSTGNQTSNHYDMWLAEDTAARVKRQFVARYGDPLFTVGLGGSGGAIQQYIIGQNNPGLLDAGIPLYGYPDMVTQTIYALDCELLEYYFDVTDGGNPRWRDFGNRRLVQGLNSVSETDNRDVKAISLLQLAYGRMPNMSGGTTECVLGWRGLTPLVHNPRYAHFMTQFDPAVADKVQWTYWDDLRYVYGRDDSGFARHTYDNVGVQYGLNAMIRGQLTVEEFLDLNARVGGWKTPGEMQRERFWRVPGAYSRLDQTAPWSHQNQTAPESNGDAPARRSRGHVEAIRAAFQSGQVFAGDLHIPVIDLRHYLDDELDMHHSIASFSTRLRIERAMGHSDHQVIWMSDKPYTPIGLALDVIDEWLANLRANPQAGIAAARPAAAVDTCFGQDGTPIARGEDVWNGPWNDSPVGACTAVYPPHETSRTVAGDAYHGDVFKCALKPVAVAVADGTYGELDMAPWRSQLERVFPEGVCDYAVPGAGQPRSLWARADGDGDDRRRALDAGGPDGAGYRGDPGHRGRGRGGSRSAPGAGAVHGTEP